MLTTIRTYFIQCTSLPSSTCKELDKINRGFLWGSLHLKRKMHALNWETITLPKENGGLGMPIARERNQAMLANFAWRLGNSRETWIKLLNSKYLKTLGRSVNGGSTNGKALSQGMKVLKEGEGWIIGEGV